MSGALFEASFKQSYKHPSEVQKELCKQLYTAILIWSDDIEELYKELQKESDKTLQELYDEFYKEPCTKSLITSVKRSWTRSLHLGAFASGA